MGVNCTNIFNNQHVEMKFLNLSAIKKSYNVCKKRFFKFLTQAENILPYYYSLIACVIFLWLAESYITSALGTLNAWCVCDLNKTAFGWLVFFSVSLYIGVSIWKYVRRGLYVSHRYLCWWSTGLAYYLYYRLLSSHFLFWGINVLGMNIAYLDLLVPAFLTLVILKILNSVKETERTSGGIILSDEPISDIESDLFGYKDIVWYLKGDLETVNVTEHAFSVGITGEWGTGKSSFLNIFEKSIDDSNSIVVRFYPRSSTKPDKIQDDFFDVFSEAIGKYHTSISGTITRYIRALKLVDGEGLFNRLTDAFESFNVEDERNRICEAISKIGRTIYVIIEDLDRLSGIELLEVLKLIDRNGAFCNVIYMSAYDKQYVNGVLKQTLGHQIDGDFTDKYFCYELPLPVQKTWVIKSFIAKYLREHTLSISNDMTYSKELAGEWEKVGSMVVMTLGTIRHVKRFINLFMSRYVHVMDDVNVGDFLLLTLIRYSNITIYNAIVNCQFVRRGGFMSGSETTMYLVEGYEKLLEELGANENAITIVKELFPIQDGSRSEENGYKRLRRAASFDLYFYDRYSYKIYYKDIAPIFEEKDDDSALAYFGELMSQKTNWSMVEEYLRYRGLDWITNVGLLRRYIKLIILAYHKTDRNLNYYASFVRLFFKYSEEEFEKLKAVENSGQYSKLLYDCLDEMTKTCHVSIGAMLVSILDEFRKNTERPSECVLKDNQYTDLALKALKAYTEQTNVVIDPFISMQLSVIHPIGEQGILEKSRKFITDKVNANIEAYASSMFTSAIRSSGKEFSLILSLREPEMLSQIFSDWNTQFPKWIKKLPKKDMQYVFNELFEAHKRYENVVVKALENTYAHNDYAGFKRAIENNKKQERVANKTEQVFDFIARHNEVTTANIAEALDMPKTHVLRIVKKLMKDKRIEAFGAPRLRKYKLTKA